MLCQLIIKYGSDKVVYIDECGFEQYSYREYGYSLVGQKIYADKRGNAYARTNLIMAKQDSKYLAPMLYKNNTDRELVNYCLIVDAGTKA